MRRLGVAGGGGAIAGVRRHFDGEVIVGRDQMVI